MTLDLDSVDRDGAVREARDAVLSRAQLLGGAVAALAAAGLATAGVASAQVGTRDRSVLGYLLSLEYLQDAFYTEAERLGALGGSVAAATQVLGRVERAHVQAFRELLGSSAAARPRFDFQGATEDELAFLRTALALEELSVGAYAGQATRLQSPEILQSTMDIHTVEARHAAWLRRLLDMRPTEGSFDRPRDRRSVVGTIASKGFVVARSEVPVAFGTSARSADLTDWPAGGYIGIHGTDRPELVPGRVSHGCIRMRNGDIVRLARLMPVGTPVTVRS